MIFAREFPSLFIVEFVCFFFSFLQKNSFASSRSQRARKKPRETRKGFKIQQRLEEVSNHGLVVLLLYCEDRRSILLRRAEFYYFCGKARFLFTQHFYSFC